MKRLFLTAAGLAYGFFGPLATGDQPISESAKRRVKQNVDIIQKNIEETKKNIEVSRANIKTIEAELRSLQELEREHLALKARFGGVIASSNKSISQNEKAIQDLKNYEKKRALASKGKKADEGDEEAAAASAKERGDLERWEITAKEKLAKVRQLHDEVLKNLSEISARKSPLEQQLREWNRRQKEYETQISQFEKRRDSLEKMADN